MGLKSTSQVYPLLLDGVAQPHGLRAPLHGGERVAVAPPPLGGRVGRCVVRDPTRDEVVRAQRLGRKLVGGARLTQGRQPVSHGVAAPTLLEYAGLQPVGGTRLRAALGRRGVQVARVEHHDAQPRTQLCEHGRSDGRRRRQPQQPAHSLTQHGRPCGVEHVAVAGERRVGALEQHDEDGVPQRVVRLGVGALESRNGGRG